MKITVEFDNEDEFEAFKTSGKRTRSGKTTKDEGETGGAAPEPLKPPAGGTAQTFNPTGNAATFAPQGAGAGQTGGAFPVHVATGPAPEILALVERIKVRIDGAIASGQPAAAVLDWFQKQLGPETANYSMEQIKEIALPKASKPILDGIAGLMNA